MSQGAQLKMVAFLKMALWLFTEGSKKIGEGKIRSLQKESKTIKEVHAGFECAFLVEGFSDWEVDDKVECFLEMIQEKK